MLCGVPGERPSAGGDGEERLRLLPFRQPQPGFESRVLAPAALTLAVAVSAVGGWSLGVATSSPARSTLGSAALLSASGQPVGTIFFYGGRQQWLSMSVSLFHPARIPW